MKINKTKLTLTEKLEWQQQRLKAKQFFDKPNVPSGACKNFYRFYFCGKMNHKELDKELNDFNHVWNHDRVIPHVIQNLNTLINLLTTKK